MDVRVPVGVPQDPFLGAQYLFETEYDLDWPVLVAVRDDPDERTWTAHYAEHHLLNISRQAASSAMGRELVLHEYAHMYRYEQGHPSHLQSTAEALILAFTGRQVEQRKLTHCYQIANHMKDIYADDITLDIAPATKLLAFLEAGLATAVADRPIDMPGAVRHTRASDPDITAVNAAFALGLAERHDLIGPGHRLYELAGVAAADAPNVDVESFKRTFRTLARDPDSSAYRKSLVDITRKYAMHTGGHADAAAD
ncbi:MULTISPECIES: DUF5781 family protein [unclassified Haladaptatus]|uniref:DUF5781 family protein n=1 Tax=unclassified Haladaptatus TaxID=2622732 RepID=UPI0023E8EB63|nr:MULTISPECIES: DUF5781 family protein [unclassified Haladaptatus]